MTARDPHGDPPRVFAADVNLGFPLDDPAWREFFAGHGVQIASYDDMQKLTEDLGTNATAMSYLPAANYYYLRDDPAYVAVTSALYAADQTAKLTSLLVVGDSSGVESLDQLRGARLGYAHPYCTTSYFAPALLLLEHGQLLSEFFAELVQVAPYQGQIDAVVADRVDATMVQEDVWRKRPANGEDTRVIAKMENLPTPLMVVNTRAGEGFTRELTKLMLAHRPPVTSATLFSGFVPYQREQVGEFFAASERAFSDQAG